METKVKRDRFRIGYGCGCDLHDKVAAMDRSIIVLFLGLLTACASPSVTPIPPLNPHIDLSGPADEARITSCQAEIAARPSCIPDDVGFGPGKRSPRYREIDDCTERQRRELGPACQAATPLERLKAAERHNDEWRRALAKQSEDRLAAAAARRDRMKPQVDAAGDRWAGCVQGAALRLARSPEPAETVVAAAFGACLPEETDYEKIYKDGEGYDFRAILTKVKRELAPRYLALVMAARQLPKTTPAAPNRAPEHDI